MKHSPLTPQAFLEQTGVSRETVDRLSRYADLLIRWQARINLVGQRTLADLWRRHMLDSAQLYSLLPQGTVSLLDIGSGAGFPGLVLAVLGVADVHLVESDSRKCAFLSEAARATDTSVTIHNVRQESLIPWQVDVVTARALAPLPKLLGLAMPFLQNAGVTGLFLKGETVEQELTQARKQWSMVVEQIPSRSDPAGAVLRIKEISGD